MLFSKTILIFILFFVNSLSNSIKLPAVYEYILEDKNSFLNFIQTISGHNHKTFPIIFYEGAFIGGLNETKTFIDKLVLSFEDIF